MGWRDLFRRLFGPGGEAAAGPPPLATSGNARDDPPPPLSWDTRVYAVAGQDGWEGAISWLGQHDARRLGLPPEAVIAVVVRVAAPLDDANLLGNAAFPPFLQACMPVILDVSPTLEAAAARFGDGDMVIPDRRGLHAWARNPRGFAPSTIMRIGTVSVRGGRIEPGSYRPNPAYRGFVPGYGLAGVAALPEEFYPVLLRRLEGGR